MPGDARDMEGVPTTGTIIDEKYRVVGIVGSGGMGCLVSADHLLMKKAVAIKFVLADRSAATRRRLFREARAAQALSSDHVVRVFDLGVHEEAPYIVMELLEGTDLAGRVATEGPLPPHEAVDCVIEACVAVAEAHALGIIHRDIKPANLFSTRTRTQQLVKVLDFGISKLPETAEEDCDKTAEDAVLGTPYYCSPEQLRNPAKIDHRTDVWALGVTLFHLLTGEHPFAGNNAREVTAAIFTDKPRDARDLRPDIPEALSRAIAAALVKRPEERTATVAAFVQELLPCASKRGRLAAERVALYAPLPALNPAVETVTPRPRAPLSTTEAGVSSTLRDGGPQTRAFQGRWLVAALFGVSVATGAFAWWPETSNSRAHAGVSPTVLPTVAPRPAAKPIASAVPDVTTSAPAPLPRRITKPLSAAPAASPAASSAATPPAPSSRRDIDGVPIVE